MSALEIYSWVLTLNICWNIESLFRVQIHLDFSPAAINIFACVCPISQSLTKAQGKHTGFSNFHWWWITVWRLLEFLIYKEFLSYRFQHYNNK